MDFQPIERNLRHSFRALAVGRPGADLLDFPGISIVSLGVTFAMFNAAFLSSPVDTLPEIERRLRIARDHFESRRLGWSFWVCEDWLTRTVGRALSRTCDSFGLHLSSEMPGMAAEDIHSSPRALPNIEFHPVTCTRTLNDFRAIGSLCFHVPIAWFSEVFNDEFPAVRDFKGWVGYDAGLPVCSGATVATNGTIGLYNVATVPDRRGRGYGEAMTRHLIRANPQRRTVLQSSSQGFRLYERMGFRAITRILVYSSAR